MHAPPGCPGGVLRTGKVRVFFSKAWYSMSEKSEITGNPDENWYTGDV